MWQTVARGDSLDELAATVANFELKKGTKIRFEMDLNMPVAFLFDMAGAEHLFSMPEGVDLVDVYGEGWSKAVVEAEADPAWLVGILVFIRAHWIAIVVGAYLLSVIVSFIRMLADIIPDLDLDWLKWIVLGVVAVLGYRLLRKKAPT
ncbi:hypothetical protein ES703_04122 [subsurface metagenome]